MDSRTVASSLGVNEYAFERQGGLSWSIPYMAGIYALACQAKRDITPDIFWEKALDTGMIINHRKDGKVYKLGKIINPLELITSLQKIN